MYLICYLAYDLQYVETVRDRLTLVDPASSLVVARTTTEAPGQIQTLPVRAVLIDAEFPRDAAIAFTADVHHCRQDVMALALSPGVTEIAWWKFASELLRLDEPLELFRHRLLHGEEISSTPAPVTSPSVMAPVHPHTETTLISSPEFRRFSEIFFSGMDESTLSESFIAWVQQACQTSRAILLLRDQINGTFRCGAQRGLPSTLAFHLAFNQVSPLCHWLSSYGRILLSDAADDPLARQAVEEMGMMQAVAAVPIFFDGRLMGIIGIGPRLLGQGYTATELEALFALGGHFAASISHRRLHRELREQQQMTEHMLYVMPTAVLVVNTNGVIAFANPAAARLLGKSVATLPGCDLRVMPSPLGDLAFATLQSGQDQPRNELRLAGSSIPLAVSCYALGTTPPGAMLLIEDLTASKQLAVERERRVNLDVITNLVHYFAHELRNPLVAVSTYSKLGPTRAQDPEFQEYCSTVLSKEIDRINLILDQLLMLSNQIEMKIIRVDLLPILDRVAHAEEMRTSVITSLPESLTLLYGDEGRLETAFTCILRSALRHSSQKYPITLKVGETPEAVYIDFEVPVDSSVVPERLLQLWPQFIEMTTEEVDLGLATAEYIMEQHSGTLHATVHDGVLTIRCNLPLHSSVPVQEDSNETEDTHR